MSEWRDEYQGKFISADQAAGFVKPGDHVAFTMGREAYAIGKALAARRDELKDVNLFIPTPAYHFDWYNFGWEDTFNTTIMAITGAPQQMIDDQRGDIETPDLFGNSISSKGADVLFAEVSLPDGKGFCSFGNSLWNKKSCIKNSRLVIAEVNKALIRTYGENFIHVSEIDYFVEHTPTGRKPGTGSLAEREKKEPEPYLKDVAGYVFGLIKDGDTIQIGVGRTTEPLVQLGIFNGKHDLGWHSEATPSGTITLVKEGVITGKYKTLNPNKCVVTSLGGGTKEEMEWAAENPLFWLLPVEYLWDIKVIGAHDNMVAINNALAVDFTGQITAETIGTYNRAAAGGQTVFAFGALVSKGGRSITVLPSTAKNKTVSRIVSRFEAGVQVTLPRTAADYVVTEYGIASLRGKSRRQRAEELIAIAHPDFRAGLKKEARKMLWPE